MAFTPVSGNDGRVRNRDTGGVLAGLNKWEIVKTTAKVTVPHFESDVDPDGNVWPGLVRGLSGATGTASGFYDVDPGNVTDVGKGLSNGLFVHLDLILVKLAPWGIPNVPVFIEEIRIGTDNNNQAASFNMNFTVVGICGKTQLVT